MTAQCLLEYGNIDLSIRIEILSSFPAFSKEYYAQDLLTVFATPNAPNRALH